MEPSQEDLNRILRYEPDTGKLFWKSRPKEDFSRLQDYLTWEARWANREAFTAMNGFGYHCGSVNGKVYTAQRIIWTLVYGSIPKTTRLSHINGDPSDNRLSNIYNKEKKVVVKKDLPSNNKSGFKGVSLFKPTGKWRSVITAKGKTHYLGYFDTPEEAHEARKKAEKRFKD